MIDREASLANGYHVLPPGKIAAVVTYLDMRSPPERPLAQAPPGLSLQRVERPDLDWYRMLFRRVGQEWLWFSRLTMADDRLRAILHDPDEEIYALVRNGVAIGLLELDFRSPPDCELAFLGVAPDVVGSGAGRFLMDQAISRAFARGAPYERFFVHTCTLDHPRALEFYVRSGFTAYGRAVEIADDPRLDGRLPRDAASWLPVI